MEILISDYIYLNKQDINANIKQYFNLNVSKMESLILKRCYNKKYHKILLFPPLSIYTIDI